MIASHSACFNPATENDGCTKGTTTAAAVDTITVLFCEPGYSATKTHRLVGDEIVTIGYNAGMWFRFRTYMIEGIHQLSEALSILEPLPKAFVVRGEPNPELDQKVAHRRTKTMPNPNFATPGQGRRYLMIDIDKLALPDALPLASEHLPCVIEFAINQLPPEFHDVSYHWQLSSSAGIRSSQSVSLHLWFWLSAPVPDAQLKAWATSTNGTGTRLIDAAMFNDIQIHFTAAPVFEGLPDPFAKRSGLVEKMRHEVDILLPPSAVPQYMQRRSVKRHLPLPLTKGGAADTDPVIDLLSRAGHYLGPLAGVDGAHRIVCPWVQEHSGEDPSGTAYFSPSDQNNGRGGFKCHHSHCQERTVANLMHFLVRLQQLSRS